MNYQRMWEGLKYCVEPLPDENVRKQIECLMEIIEKFEAWNCERENTES